MSTIEPSLLGRSLPSPSAAPDRWDGPAPPLNPGEVVQARVLRTLGDALFEVLIGNRSVVTASTLPLKAGQVLTLQATGTRQGPQTAQVLTIADGEIAKVQNVPPDSAPPAEVAALPKESTPLREAASGARGLLSVVGRGTNALSRPVPAQDVPATAGTSRTVEPDGPVGRLLAARPDLAPRVASLLNRFESPGGSLGLSIEQLVQEGMPAFAATGPHADFSDLTDRLTSQLIAPKLLENPKALADVLASRIGDWLGTLEFTLGQLSTNQMARESSPAPAAASPAVVLVAGNHELAAPAEGRMPAPLALPADSDFQNLTSTQSVPPASVRPPQPAPPAAIAPPTSDGPDRLTSPSITRSSPNPDPNLGKEAAAVNVATRDTATRALSPAVDRDLKANLLLTRGRLAAVAEQPAAAASIQPAISRADTAIDQITAQQIRNIEAQGQYLHVELPVDSKSGIGAARLQVLFRRDSPGKEAVNADDRFTVALYLSLTKLGSLLATITGTDGGVTVHFTVADEPIRDVLAGSADELRRALLAAGHSGATVTVRRLPARAAGAGDPVLAAFLAQAPTEGDPGLHLNREA